MRFFATTLVLFLGMSQIVQAQDSRVKLSDIYCLDPRMAAVLEKIKPAIAKVNLEDSGSLRLIMRDGSLVYIQSGAGCMVTLLTVR